jgi:hypothetical protein
MLEHFFDFISRFIMIFTSFTVNNTPCLLFFFLSAQLRARMPLNGFSVVFDPGLKFPLVENCSSQPFHIHWNIKSAPASTGRSRVGPAL